MGSSLPLDIDPNRSLAFYMGVFLVAFGVIVFLFGGSLAGVPPIIIGGAMIALTVWLGRIKE